MDLSVQLLPNDLDQHSLPPLAVELRVINLLPGAEIEFPVGHGNHHFVTDQEILQVRVAICLTGAMVTVITAEGRQLFQSLLDVCDQPAFRVIHIHPGSDVHG